jgi:methylenetetrahydrofolate reductase (NADPH)
MSDSKLSELLGKNEFVVTCEINPSPNSGADSFRQLAGTLKPAVDAVIVKDNPTATVGMAALTASALFIHEDIEPVLEMTARDRNRLALQSDALGAGAMGIPNILCQTGKFHTLGDQPAAKSVYDLDSIQLLQMLRSMRDDNKLMNGSQIDTQPKFMLGAVWNASGGPSELRVMGLAKKIEAGAEFVIAEGITNLDQFSEVMNEVRSKGLHEKTKIIAGVVVDSHDAAQDLIKGLREIDGVAGVNIIAGDAIDNVPKIVEGAGLFPRP